MKNSSVFTFLILLSLFLTPFQSVQAALVPVEKTINQSKVISKKNKKKSIHLSKKNSKKRFKTNRTKQFRKPNRQNIYGIITALVIGAICLYFSIPITLLIVGLTLAIPGLWIASICLFALPFLLLLIAWIVNSVNYANYQKEEKLKRESQNKNEQ
jgi:Flp pilus assembly protein TadB